MREISRRNREKIEDEFMALILNKNELLDLIQIKPKYLVKKENQILLQQVIDCWKDLKIVDFTTLVQKNSNFDIDRFFELYTGTWFHSKCWGEQLKISEESIVKYYKEDIIKDLNERLEIGKISYDDFMQKMKKLDEIKIVKLEKNVLSISDIDTSKEEEIVRIKSNLYEFDGAIKGFALGQLSVWSGSNASAKSTYLNQIALESINQGFNTLIYSGELVAKRLLKWIVMQSAGKKEMVYNKSKDYWYVNDEVRTKIERWLNNKLFIYNNTNGNKVKDILCSISECVKKNNVKVVVLDNLMSMNLSSYGDNKYDVQSQFVQELSELAKKLDIHIHFVCHPRKVTSFLRKIDISGSADLTNIADNVFILHRVNNDFRIKTKEMFKWNDSNDIYKYSNVIEICKNRDFGVEDRFIGMYFEPESKRLLNSLDEFKYYKWKTSWE